MTTPADAEAAARKLRAGILEVVCERSCNEIPARSYNLTQVKGLDKSCLTNGVDGLLSW